MKKYITLTGAALLGTVVAHEGQMTSKDQRASFLKQRLAALEDGIETVRDELESLRYRKRASSFDNLEVQKGGFGHVITHHGGDILSGAAQLGQLGLGIYQATQQHVQEPNVQGWGSLIGHGIEGGLELGGDIYSAVHGNVQSEYPEVERGIGSSIGHQITHHGGSWVNGINDAANLGLGIYQATHHPQVESEYYPEVERGFGGLGHIISHHGGDIIQGGAGIYQATQQNPQVERGFGGLGHIISHHGGDIIQGGNDIYQASQNPNVQRGGFGHIISHHGGDILSGGAQLGQLGLNIYQATQQPQVESEYYPEVERGFGGLGHHLIHHGGDYIQGGADIYQASQNPNVQKGGFGHIISHHGGDILSGGAQLGQLGLNIYNTVHGNNVMSTPYDSDDEVEYYPVSVESYRDVAMARPSRQDHTHGSTHGNGHGNSHSHDSTHGNGHGNSHSHSHDDQDNDWEDDE